MCVRVCVCVCVPVDNKAVMIWEFAILSSSSLWKMLTVIVPASAPRQV